MTDMDFESTWDNIIYKKILQLTLDYGDLVCPASAKDDVKEFYEETLAHAKRHYLVNAKGLLNRYKVAAAMMIAILKARPIKKAASKYYVEDSDKWIFNEQVALNTGLKIVRNFIIMEIMEKGGPQTEEDRILYSRFSKSIPLVKEERQRWEIELYYMRREGSYSLLSIAHELEDFVELVITRAYRKRYKKQRLEAIDHK